MIFSGLFEIDDRGGIACGRVEVRDRNRRDFGKRIKLGTEEVEQEESDEDESDSDEDESDEDESDEEDSDSDEDDNAEDSDNAEDTV